jgi:hypothetical protein
MRIVARWVWLCAAALVVSATATTTASAQPPEREKPSDPAALERLDQLLANWERLWTSTRAVETQFLLVKRFPDWGAEDRYEGAALVAHPDKLKVTLDVVEPDPAGGAPRRRFHHQIIGSGPKMIFVASDTKQVFIDGWGGPNGQTVLCNELLMLVFGMKADAVKARFRVTLIKQTPQADYLQFFPKQPGAGAFSRFDLVLDHKTLLPSYLRFVDRNGKDTQTYTFTKARRNPPGVTDSDFVLTALPKGWTVEDLRLPEPLKSDPGASGRPLPPPVYSEVAPAGGRGR